ncbi:hypothetical protein B0H14DRAFT_3163679 [Mycena olivaceomarginata]|nr:hypothetical protein B0H14DRAFT_3163679 [Mycena olivaceomarginata]
MNLQLSMVLSELLLCVRLASTPPSYTECPFSTAPMPSSKKLADAFTNAQRLQALCQTTTGLHAYQRIATLAVEFSLALLVWLSNAQDSQRKVAALVVYAAKRTDTLVNNGAGIPLSPEHRQVLDKFERHVPIHREGWRIGLNHLPNTLELIRRHIESVPERGTKPLKFRLATLAFFHHSRRLEAELDRVYHSLTSKARAASRNEYILEVATLSTRAASAICEIPLPGLSFLKPAVGMAALICDTAKDLTNSVVERARKTSPQAKSSGVDAVAPLVLTLEDVQAFSKRLQGRHHAASWILAGKDKERFAELNAALDRALVVFCGSQSIAITAGVHGNIQDLAALVATVHRVEDGIKRTMAVVHSNRAANTALVPETTAFVPIISPTLHKPQNLWNIPSTPISHMMAQRGYVPLM